MTATHNPATPAGSPTRAIVYVTAEGLPDAWVVNEREVELHVTQPARRSKRSSSWPSTRPDPGPLMSTPRSPSPTGNTPATPPH